MDEDTGRWPDGAVVVESELGFWDGSRFVPTWGRAKKYRPCTADYLSGIRAAEKASGLTCWSVSIQPTS